ncbi:uncharacterized protein FA14DRAFT_174545 [Meira miltonrushii]|uniref:ArfGap-domain-containing protein n=1 Tax=Meira miltonrushii TaxID=1280837 RepID=A0A316V8Q6_9BASI|nr:uncharacterized protein FA14DRAFT_174545 [Meira miltonrushii]PWN32871.1 hypothetical protein FA14DRAFT_174545 [Meira miltonrushii]
MATSSSSNTLYEHVQSAGGNHILLNDPSQLSILGIRIAAQCTFEELQRSRKISSTPRARSSIDHANQSTSSRSRTTSQAKREDEASSTISGITASSSSKTNTACPPSSFRDPMAGKEQVKSRRPRSVEIGAKAKGAMIDLGRKGLYGLRNLSRSDVSQTRDQHQMVIAPSMNDTDDLIAISTSNGSIAGEQRRASSHSIVESTTSKSQSICSNSQPFPSMDNTEQETIRAAATSVRSILRVRRTYRLRPCSMTYGRESPASSQTVPISIINRVEARSASIGGEDSGWERLESAPTEYMGDAEQEFSNEGRAGHFHTIESRNTSENQDVSGDYDYTQDSWVNDSTMESAGEMNKLLLKVVSPIETFARIAGAERMAFGWKDEVILKIRLQIKLHSPSNSMTPLSPSLSNRAIPAGPRRPRSSSLTSESTAEKQVIFLSCNSAQKLCEAIESSRIRQNGLNGPLSSQSSAKLEGIDWVPVQKSTTSKPTDFEWSWKDTANGQEVKIQESGENAVKCACAFVVLDKIQSTVQPLAFFQFLIGRSAYSIDRSTQQKPTFVWMDIPQKDPSSEKAQQEELLFNGQAIGLGLEGVDPKLTARSPRPSATRSRTNSESVDEGQMKLKARLSRSSLLATKNAAVHAPQQLNPSEQLFASPGVPLNTSKALIQFSSSDLNHVELGLADVESDSPIFRAAIQNIERRTTNLKRVAKGMLKAANDVSQATEELQVTEVRLDHTFEDMAALMPATFGRLSSDWLFRSREAEREKREQTIAMMEMHVIAPMRAVVDMCRELVGQLKAFDTESKTYYSATQKWLSSKSSNQVNTQPVLNEYSPEAIGFDKAMIKQEKLDEKQKWRQLRFDLSRFEMYRSICTLHEGEAEILVASHMLSLCRWQCKDFSAENVFRNFDSTAQTVMINVKAKADAALERCLDLDRRIAEHQRVMLSREGEGQMGIEPSPIPDIPSDNQLGINSRQTGHKLKNLLTSIGVGHLTSPSPHNQSSSVRQPFSCPIPPASNFETTENDSPSKQSRQQSTLESKSPMGSIASPVLPSSGNKWQARLRSFSFSKSPTMHDSERRLFVEGNHLVQSPVAHEKVVIPDVNIVTAETMMGDASPRRSISMSGSRQSPNKRPITLDLSTVGSSQALVSPKTKRPSANGQANVTFSVPSPRNTEQYAKSPAFDSKAFLSAPTSQPQRKKEGILWAMTKPIQGMGGSDAPKSVSRSQNWRECWVVLSGSGHLGEFAHWKDAKAMTLEPSQPLIDLRFATVREARGVERRFTFEVITRENRRFFQASNDEDMRGWIGAISFAIESLINGTSSIRQIDKVARHSAAQAIDSFGMSTDSTSAAEFGDGMRHVFDNALTPFAVNGIGAHKSFSQSLTDLSSAASGRLFNRYGHSSNNGTSTHRDEVSKAKRDSKNMHAFGSRGHLLALSEGDHAGSSSNEGNEYTDSKEGLPFTPSKNDRHSRGISNNTPVSGYMAGVLGHSSHLNVGSTDDGRSLSSSSLNVNTEFDKRIEAMIHSSYGAESSSSANSGSGFHSRAHSSNRDSNGLTMSSSAASRNPSSIGPGSADEEGRLMNKQGSDEGSNKFARAREILAIASLPQNKQCADCRKPDPRWASWNLNGMPCCIFICIECSGIHRGLGVSVSKVRSVDLDDWNEQQLKAARIWGNERANAIYEANKPLACTVASMGDVRSKAFWTTKYVEQAWFSLHPTSHNDSNQTIMASSETEEEDMKHGDLTTSQSWSTQREEPLPWQSYENRQRKSSKTAEKSKTMILPSSSSERVLQQSSAHNRLRTSLPPSSDAINSTMQSNSAVPLPRISA